MSIYEGTVGEQEYSDGIDQGRAAAEGLAVAGLPSWMADAQAEGWERLRTAQSARSRAFYVGWLRGFREVSR